MSDARDTSYKPASSDPASVDPAASGPGSFDPLATLRAGGRLLVRVLCSHGTVIIILLLLMLLTFFGTIEQQYLNLFDVQTKYFESWFVLVPMGSISVPLPGAYFLLGILFVSLIVGGMVRMRWSLSRLGILVIHVGMALLLLGGFIEFNYSVKGYLNLNEEEEYEDANDNGRYDPDERFADWDRNGRWSPGESSDRFFSYYLHDFVVVQHRDDGSVREFLLPNESLERAAEEPVTFAHEDLPLDVVITGFARNSKPIRASQGALVGVRGIALRALPPDPQNAAAHQPGFYVTLRPRQDGGKAVRELIWAGQRYPAQASAAGSLFDLDIRRRSYAMPFRVQLHDAVHRKYPGTRKSMEYSSHVSKIENDVSERRHISMNEPLRHKGFTLYQSKYDERPNGPDNSGFAVVRNPSDQIPLIACLVILAGMLFHFVRKLFLHIKSQQRRRAVA